MYLLFKEWINPVPSVFIDYLFTESNIRWKEMPEHFSTYTFKML